jgi:oligopeptide transport system substrate-binding protein
MKSGISYIVLTLVVFLVLTTAACTQTTTPPDTSDTPRGGQLRWSIDGIQDLSNLDPALADEQQSITVMRLVFSGLVRLDEELAIQPDAAEYWDVSDDGKTYTFTIRPDLKFGDGTPVTAHDFVYSINRSLMPHTGGFSAPDLLKHIVGASAVIEGQSDTASGLQALDDHTLEIQLDEPLAYFLSLLGSPTTMVVPRHRIEEQGDTWTDQAVGTGPFRVKEWNHNEYILLEANPHYWRGMPGIDTIMMPFYPDSEEAFQDYQQGELDIMGNPQTGIPAARIAEVENQPDYRTTPALAVRYIGFNNEKPPFDNINVRQAFALSVDRQDIAQRVLNGTVEPTTRILPRGLMGSKLPIRGQTFDPQGARAALKLAGYLTGNDLPPLTLAYGEEGDNALVAESLKQTWYDILGVDITLEPLDLKMFSQRLDETYYEPDQGLFMYLSIWGADYPDPQNFLSQQLRTDLPNNNGHWSNAQFDELVDQADRMGAYEQQSQRLKLYNQAEQIALDEVGWLPLYNPQVNILLRPTVHGLVYTPLDIIAPDWTRVRIVSLSEQE